MRTNTNLKSTTAITIEVPAKGAKASAAATMELVQKAINGAKNLVQTIQAMEPLLADASLACLQHCEKYRDATLMDKLVKGLPIHPSMTKLRDEIVAWNRQMGPIRWKADGSVYLAKEGDQGYNDFDTEKASDVPFNETAGAKRARDADAKAHKASITEFSIKTLRARVFGLRKAYQAAMEEDKNGIIKGVKKGEKSKILKALEAIETSFTEVVGEEVKEEKAT